MTSARHAADSRLAAVTYAGPEWMGKANWHSVAETYLFKALGKPGLYALTRLMLAVNRRFPDVLLNRRYDGLERLMGWVPGVSGTRTERVQLPNCPAEWTWNVKNESASSASSDAPVVIYFHGSAFIALGINSHRPLVSHIARDSGARALSVGYRLCPRNLVEDAIADGVDAYRYVLSQGVDPDNIVLAGDSAGGFLAAMTAIAVGVSGTRTERVQLPNCPAEWTWNVKNESASSASSDAPVVIYFHGSAFIALGINSHRPLVSHIARDSGARALSVGYRLCPRNLVEDAIADGVDAYRYVLSQGVDPDNIVLAGDSAGGFLAAMTAIAVRDQGLTPPAGCVLISAATSNDMEPKYAVGKRVGDAMFPVDFLRMINDVFLLRNGAREPGACPVDADLTGLGPFLLQVGSQEALRPDSELLAERLVAAGVPVRLQIFDRAIHVFQVFAMTNPDARRAVAEITDFIKVLPGLAKARQRPGEMAAGLGS
ncbi:acetyl-hydrolase [Mycobacteroides abscessus]|nr:acetyl-hydrolase [Mycobacteroides abscessus]